MDGSGGEVEKAETSNGGFEGFERILPENCVEYMLFVIETDPQPNSVLSSLEAVRKAAVQLSNQLTRDYIWQRDGFSLETTTQMGTSSQNLSRQCWHTIY